MGSKKTTTTTSSGTQTAAPPSWTMPGISDAAARVTAAIGSLPGTKYTGQFGAVPDYTDANAAYTAAAGESGAMSDWVKGLTQNWSPVEASFNTGLGGVNTTAALPAAIRAAIDPINKQLMEQTLPGIRSSALESGAYSGDRAMTMLPELALRDAQESMQRIGAEYAYKDLQANADRELQAFGLDTTRGLGVAGLGADQNTSFMGMLPDLIDTIMRTKAGQGDLLSQVSNQNMVTDQANIDNALKANQYEWMYPFQGLDIASSLLAQLSGGYGTTTSNGTQKTVEKTGGLGSVAQGLLGAASLIGSLPVGGGASLGGNFMSSLFGGKKT